MILIFRILTSLLIAFIFFFNFSKGKLKRTKIGYLLIITLISYYGLTELSQRNQLNNLENFTENIPVESSNNDSQNNDSQNNNDQLLSDIQTRPQISEKTDVNDTINKGNVYLNYTTNVYNGNNCKEQKELAVIKNKLCNLEQLYRLSTYDGIQGTLAPEEHHTTLSKEKKDNIISKRIRQNVEEDVYNNPDNGYHLMPNWSVPQYRPPVCIGKPVKYPKAYQAPTGGETYAPAS